MPVALTINGTTIDAGRDERSLFDYAEIAGIQVPTSCVKNGKCKECIMEISQGSDLLTPRTTPESHLSGPFRLSCQTRLNADDGQVQCHTMRRGQMRIERHAFGLPVSEAPLRLEPAVTRDGDRILLDGVEIDRSTGPIHGIAMDLGTTTVVLRLFDLESGELVADTSFENPQRFGGSDVMSRIHYDTERGGYLLMRTLAGYLTHAIEALPVDPKSIYEMVIVGNSTMRDIFFRQNVYSIGQNPYQSITEIELAEGKRTSTSLTQTGRRSLLPIHPRARVYGAPVISGHVGADAAACMLAVDLGNEDRLVCVMDIGTNTELLLGNRHRILAASCPAGPAFEGGAIACGMPGLDGAIEDVHIRNDGTFELGVIGDIEPEGICGSGLVDLMGELLRTERMNTMGRFEDDVSRFVLDQKHDIFFNESDVNELAQAKGANVAGLQVIFNQYGVSFDDVDVFYLAGGFGRHLKLDASRGIGLIPNIATEKIVQAGNAAVEGACIALLSMSKRRELEALVRRVEHCRLETHPQFFDYFVEGCQFRPVESTPVRRRVSDDIVIELSSVRPVIDVQPEEYLRLLGYPRDYVLEDRALELAEGARRWYASQGHPWTYAREASAFTLSDDHFVIDGVKFTSPRVRRSLADAHAASVVIAAVGAGPEVEVETQRLWLAEKPDEYFFLEVYGSAVVEYLVTRIGAELCALAETGGRAVLPHYSPGYPEWDIAEQGSLLDVLTASQTRALPGTLGVMESGMLRPKKSLLAVFGVTADAERVRALGELNPCTSCSLPRCQYRRVAYGRPRSRVLAEI